MTIHALRSPSTSTSCPSPHPPPPSQQPFSSLLLRSYLGVICFGLPSENEVVINLLLSNLKFAYSKEVVKFACLVSSCITAFTRRLEVYIQLQLIISKNNFTYYIAPFLRSWRLTKKCVKLLQSAIQFKTCMKKEQGLITKYSSKIQCLHYLQISYLKKFKSPSQGSNFFLQRKHY